MFLGLTKLINYTMRKYNKIVCVYSLVFDSHDEHHLEMTKTTKSNSSLKKYLKELYPHQNTTDTDVYTDNCKRALK